MKAIASLALAALLVAAATVAPVDGLRFVPSKPKRNFKFAKASDKEAVAGLTKGRVKSANQTVDRATGKLASVFDSYDYLMLAVQKCESGSDWTMHGLWPSDYDSNDKPSYCSSTPFSQSALSTIWSEIEQYWPTCSWSSNTEVEFLSHEWTKHGTCFGTDEYTYFSDALEIFLNGAWRSQCDDSEKDCKVTVTLPSA